jgi:hypothetical protein
MDAELDAILTAIGDGFMQAAEEVAFDIRQQFGLLPPEWNPQGDDGKCGEQTDVRRIPQPGDGE